MKSKIYTEILYIRNLLINCNVDSNNGFLLNKSNKRIGGIDKTSGYRRCSSTINGKRRKILEHRVIFFKENGYLPEIIDHINGNRSDNRIENLREATNSQNCINSKARKSNVCGYKNIDFLKRLNKWRVQISINGYKKHIGVFSNLQDAVYSRNYHLIKNFKNFSPKLTII